ncbi:hypothetical protein [Cupriavidus sp. TMH.W2]|uniref:hypothetical protein n=1 Tax=Cupriavidus sp. TMH.W2 TaxID=3434465 RepID=UPI003D76AC36
MTADTAVRTKQSATRLTVTIAVAGGAQKVVRLGSAQIYVLNMVNPEWPTPTPDARSKRVLESLRVHKMVYENYGRWYINAAGLWALEEARNQGFDASGDKI